MSPVFFILPLLLLCSTLGSCQRQMIAANMEGQEHKAHQILSIAGVKIYKQGGSKAIFYEAGMKVDADGSPRAYHPENKGIDDLKYAGYPGNWWAILVNDRG